MPISVIIIDPENLISKTQRSKLKLRMKEWIEKDDIKDLSNRVIDSIHGEKKYNHVVITKDDEVYTLTFSHILSKHETLKKKLRDFKVRKTDPKWITYTNLKDKIKLGNGEEIPDPDFIHENKDMFISQMGLIEKIRNPFVDYVKLCLAN